MTSPSLDPPVPPRGSVLTGGEARRLGVVIDGLENGWRGCSYDLSAKTVIDHLGNATELTDAVPFVIPAHGMVEVIARETLKMPPSIIAFAMVKTRLTVSGIFALNIGIVDPTYEGGVSTTLINFGNSPFEFKANTQFLRLTFHTLSEPVDPAKETALPKQNAAQYLDERKQKAKGHFSKTFLDMEGTAKAVSTELLGEWKKNLFIWIPAVALVFALLTLILNAAGLIWNMAGAFRRSVGIEEVRSICSDVAKTLIEKRPERAQGEIEETRKQRSGIAGVATPDAPLGDPSVPVRAGLPTGNAPEQISPLPSGFAVPSTPPTRRK